MPADHHVAAFEAVQRATAAARAVVAEVAQQTDAALEHGARVAEWAAEADQEFRRWRAGHDWRGLIEWLGEQGRALAPALLAVACPTLRAALAGSTASLPGALRAGPRSERALGYQPESRPTHPRTAARTLVAAPGAPSGAGSAAA